jgi:hypothetical protein
MIWPRSKSAATRFFLALAVLVCCLPPMTAAGFYGDSDGRVGLDGSLKVLASLVDFSRLPAFARENATDYALLTVTRLMAGGRPRSWFRYEVHAVGGLAYTSSGLILNDTDSTATRYRVLDARWDWLREPNAAGEILFDRFNVRFTFPGADLTLGRQAITFGKAYFWNPLDVFLAFDAAQLDRDYKQGVDGIRLDVPLGNFSGFNLIGVAGRGITATGGYTHPRMMLDSSWYGSSLLGRFFTTVSEWDLAVQAGKIYGGYQVGGALAGELGPLEVRLEAAYFKTEPGQRLPAPLTGAVLKDNLTAVFGLGRSFENSFTLEAEYLYNGNGDPDNLEAALIRRNLGFSPHLGRHMLGVLASYGFLPLLLGQLVWIYSFSDNSSLIQPSLSVSLADEIDLQLSASIGLGRKPVLGPGPSILVQSEFGSFPDVYLLELKFFF